MKIKLVTMLGLFLFAAAANAGGYVGGGLGKTDYDADNISSFDDPIGFELFAGADISPNLAVEVSFVNFGESSDGIFPEWHIEATTLAVGGLLKAPISPIAEVFFKIGFHMWDYEFSEDFNPVTIEDDGTDMFFGIGASFNINPVTKVGVRYMNYTVDTSIDEFDVTMFLVNASVGF